MKINRTRPIVAYVVVCLLCAFVLAEGMRPSSLGRVGVPPAAVLGSAREVVGVVLHPRPVTSSVPADRAPGHAPRNEPVASTAVATTRATVTATSASPVTVRPRSAASTVAPAAAPAARPAAQPAARESVSGTATRVEQQHGSARGGHATSHSRAGHAKHGHAKHAHARPHRGHARGHR